MEKHDGYQGVQHHGHHQGDQVEQRDVCEEQVNIHSGSSGVSEVTFRNLQISILLSFLFSKSCPTIPNPWTQLYLIWVRTSQGEL